MCAQRFLCESAVLCVSGCNVFMFVMGALVVRVCAWMEGWRPCVSWRGVATCVKRVLCESTGLSKEPR